MFYSTELLSLRGRGKLARVWLAAILGEEMFKKTCKAIMIKQIDVAAVCAEVSSVIEQRGRGNYVRLSLYLSSQLMFGATRILYYQTKYFQDSVINEIRNLHNRKRLRNADQEHPVSDFLFEVPEPPALALPFSRDKHLITEEPYPITSEHLIQEDMNFGVLTTDELERFLLHEGEGSFMEIRGFNWNEPTDLPENLAEDPMPGTSGINTIQSETLLPHEPISQREFLIEGSEINILAPSTPEKRPLTSPTEPPSKRSKIQPISAERELIPTTLIELEPAPVPVAEIILEQQSEQQIETHAMAPPRLSLEQQLIEASEQFNQMRTQRRIIIDRHTMLDGTSMRRRMENVTFQTTLKPCKVSLPLKLSAQEHLTKPAMHMFGTKWGKTLMTSFRRRLTYPSMVPDEFDVPRFDDVIAEEILRKDETSKVPDQTVEISQLARLETTDQSKTLERTAPLLDVERELVDQIAEQPQAESLVQVPEITVHEEKPEEAVVTVRKTFVRSSSMRLTKQDLLAQMEVLWSNQLWINFHELLPHNCSKIETARTFVLCLELHAEKVIVLKQADAFGTIWIEKYVEYSESETSTEVTSS